MEKKEAGWSSRWGCLKGIWRYQCGVPGDINGQDDWFQQRVNAFFDPLEKLVKEPSII
jgi:hypothetical protein